MFKNRNYGKKKTQHTAQYSHTSVSKTVILTHLSIQDFKLVRNCRMILNVKYFEDVIKF